MITLVNAVIVDGRGRTLRVSLGIDVACRAAHQASLADERGTILWSGRKFRTTVTDLDRLWAMLPADASTITVIMEPTRNAWVPLAAWFRRHGATVVMVPPEQSADLRAYYAKHTKSDRLDSKILARLPLLHPDGLHAAAGLGPGEPLRRAVKLRSNLVKRRTSVLARLDALLEILSPAWHAALGADLANKTPLQFLAHYADPHQVLRLGRARLGRFLHRHSRGAWGEDQADRLIAAARETFALWTEDGLEFSDLAEDIAIEARLALRLNEEIKDLDDRIAVLLAKADPTGILRSVPGVGHVLAAQILGRLGDPSRFASLAAVRSYSGLVPDLDSSGQSSRHGAPTKSGDACLREALFMAANTARRTDPSLAAKYHRLMTTAGKHHNSALCHIATTLLTRIAACWRRGERYQLTGPDGRPITIPDARRLVIQHYTVPAELRAARRAVHQQQRTGRRIKESHSAPANGPSINHSTTQLTA
ncbi:IS110 family transposase [Amycolatopsis sp. FDAARGOS 1241]|uniref:IS110 family transposase n=1 Tax=unclassified Amycolatopsis TaxID=2618356 RepID=UPI001EF21E9D|nr:IS110 family transposase [Amycolatopsis sp. FDAARGOS 1241]